MAETGRTASPGAPGWQHCLPGGELAGELQSMLLLSQRVGGMGAPAVPWEASGGCVQLFRTWSSGPLHPFAGDNFGADGLGSLAIYSWHSYEPMTSYTCLLSSILQGVGHGGTLLQGSGVKPY